MRVDDRGREGREEVFMWLRMVMKCVGVVEEESLIEVERRVR